MYDIRVETIDVNYRLEVERFLSAFNLNLEEDVQKTVVIRDKNEIIGTCCCAKNVIKSFAVKEAYQGRGIASKLITHITNDLFDKGIYETFIFTKPKNICVFEPLGYKKVATTKDVVLLEGGMANIKEYTKNMFENSGLGQGKKAALVMNCNPFTRGHRYLIEKASIENQEVVVFIVEEDHSVFPFSKRMDLVKEGTKDLKNVHILPGGKYIISSNTFPSYFIKDKGRKSKIYSKLDTEVFAKYIAPVFYIEKRYVGTEPYCTTTNEYNKALRNIFPKYGIKLRIVPRMKVEQNIVSASQVRDFIKKEKFQELKKVLPKTTYEFLLSVEGEAIIKKIKEIDFN